MIFQIDVDHDDDTVEDDRSISASYLTNSHDFSGYVSWLWREQSLPHPRGLYRRWRSGRPRYSLALSPEARDLVNICVLLRAHDWL